jgi:hypothetical protein
MIKALIQVAEVWLGLTVVYFLGSAIIHILSLWVFDEYNWILSYFVSMFWYWEWITFALILCWVFVVMAGRWVMSWASNNWWQTPNNNGN